MDGLLSVTNFGAMREMYVSANPFRHVIIDDFLNADLARQIADAFPAGDSDVWWRYQSPLERKLACNDLAKLKAPIPAVLEALNSAAFCGHMNALTGIEGLVSDPTLHGGGLHCIRRGGKLDVHLDYSLHPKLGLERRLNLIVFLNRDWKEEYGGYLELWDSKMTACVKKVLPTFNRAVIFDTGDGSYHGHPEPLNCPEGMTRKSLALYYLTPPRDGATERYKARFVKRPSDPDDPELEKFRIMRADPNYAGTTYRVDPKLDDEKR